MTYSPNRDSGYAELKNSMHIPSADFASIVQGSDIEALTTRNYAQLVYQINNLGIDGSGTVQLSGDQLKVYDGQVLAALNSLLISETYARIVEPLGTDIYIADAPAGSPSVSSVWRVQKIDTNGSRQWADGNTNFDNIATSPLSGLNYF